MSNAQGRKYDPIALSPESTVVAEYTPPKNADQAYQSEATLEAELIRTLETQAYEHLTLHSEADLIANLRTQLEALNHITFTSEEWESFFYQNIAGKNDGIKEKTTRIQEDHVQILTREDGSTKNISLVDKTNIHNNRLQVINQYAVDRGEGGADQSNRYDVTILVNGLPMVHIEIKRRGVDIREAFNQINRYHRESFWAGSGLFEYVQLFVISNGTLTKYYSNSTRNARIAETKEAVRKGKKQTSHSFEFTSWWADATNKPITDLISFTHTFFAKHSLLNILTRYCVLTDDGTLMVMRPYQIVASERILNKIEISANYKRLGTVEAGGYVWHTTGSGKTLTSFKTAQLATGLPSVDKVLFVVDRKDLDYQTMREYDRFQKGAANSNTSTAVLKRQLEDPEARIIITTIQKLSTFIKSNPGHPIYKDHVVIIFDECHRSQFGDMHTAITKAFKRYNLFGFTGTPIFKQNAISGGNPRLKTTEQAFGDKLHTYTIVDAITDKNVLPFRIDYINTLRVDNPDDVEVSAIDTEKALMDPRRTRSVVDYILEHFDQKTRRETSFSHSVVTNVEESSRIRRRAEAATAKRQVRGFNALFATASIEAAQQYYQQFSEAQSELPPDKRLKIGIIYSYAPNEAVAEDILDDEAFDAEGLSRDSRAFLESAIADYNQMFGTSWDTSADNFQSYYKDLSQRLKNRELDLVVVVNMFLTGFDATMLNTLFVDKNLKSHGLIQAYSRTNRILNSVKTYGNIVSFRNLEDATNEALELFGNKDARGSVVLAPFREYYDEYVEKLTKFQDEFSSTDIPDSEEDQKRFISEFGEILKLQNVLASFDEFEGNDPLPDRTAQDYRSVYLELHAQYRQEREGEKENINDDVVFEIELVKQVQVDVDYILMLVDKYRREHGDGDDEEMRGQITRAIDASPNLRSKRDLVVDFVDSVSMTPGSDTDERFVKYIEEKREEETQEIISAENLKPNEAKSFIDASFRKGSVEANGTEIANIMKPVSRFGGGGQAGETYGEKKQRVVDKITRLFDRFSTLSN